MDRLGIPSRALKAWEFRAELNSRPFEDENGFSGVEEVADLPPIVLEVFAVALPTGEPGVEPALESPVCDILITN